MYINFAIIMSYIKKIAVIEIMQEIMLERNEIRAHSQWCVGDVGRFLRFKLIDSVKFMKFITSQGSKSYSKPNSRLERMKIIIIIINVNINIIIN